MARHGKTLTANDSKDLSFSKDIQRIVAVYVYYIYIYIYAYYIFIIIHSINYISGEIVYPTKSSIKPEAQRSPGKTDFPSNRGKVKRALRSDIGRAASNFEMVDRCR